jgi:hypothetical protein
MQLKFKYISEAASLNKKTQHNVFKYEQNLKNKIFVYEINILTINRWVKITKVFFIKSSKERFSHYIHNYN